MSDFGVTPEGEANPNARPPAGGFSAPPQRDGPCRHCDGSGCAACDARKQSGREATPDDRDYEVLVEAPDHAPYADAYEWEAGREATPMEERNRIARECADLRDQRDDLLRKIEKLRDHINIIDDDRRVLCDELEKATGRNWVDEEARRWSS